MSELVPACPPIASCSTTIVRSPSEAAYTAAPSPDGPAPTMATSNCSSGSSGASRPNACAISRSVGFSRVRWSGRNRSTTTGRSGSVRWSGLQRAGAGLGADVVEAERDAVAAEGVAQPLRARVPGVPEHLHRLEPAALAGGPLLERLGDGAVELLVRPALRAVGPAVQPADGQRAEDGRRGGPVAPPDDGEPQRPGGEVAQRGDDVEAVVVGAAEAAEEQRDPPAGALQVREQRVGRLGCRADDPVVRAVAALELAHDAVADLGVAGDHEDRGAPARRCRPRRAGPGPSATWVLRVRPARGAVKGLPAGARRCCTGPGAPAGVTAGLAARAARALHRRIARRHRGVDGLPVPLGVGPARPPPRRCGTPSPGRPTGRGGGRPSPPCASSTRAGPTTSGRSSSTGCTRRWATTSRCARGSRRRSRRGGWSPGWWGSSRGSGGGRSSPRRRRRPPRPALGGRHDAPVDAAPRAGGAAGVPVEPRPRRAPRRRGPRPLADDADAG